MKPPSETPAPPAVPVSLSAHQGAHQGDFIQCIAQSLNAISSQDVAKLPEDQFVHVFLPLLAGDTERRWAATMADWISIAGGPYKPVDVFDNANGQTLFRVPPFFDYHGVNPVRDIHHRATAQGTTQRTAQTPFTDIIATAAQLASLHPNQAKAFVEQSLRQRANFMNRNAVLALHVLQWNTILKRYGRTPLHADAEKAAMTRASASARPGDATPDVYEDF